MNAASRTFRPPAWATLGLAIACALFVTAGLWQLDRAEQKQRLYADFDASDTADVLAEPIADAAIEASVFRPMRLSGRYDAKHQFLLDVMVHDGRVGYHVLTPLRRDGVAVLVNRGWISADADRSIVPDVTIDAGEREVSGLVAPLPRSGMRLEPDVVDATTPWPRRLTFPSAADIRAQLDYRVAGFQLLLDPQREDGFVREWRPALMTPEQHLGYAIQWFGLAVALIVIFVVVNLKRRGAEPGR